MKNQVVLENVAGNVIGGTLLAAVDDLDPITLLFVGIAVLLVSIRRRWEPGRHSPPDDSTGEPSESTVEYRFSITRRSR